MWYGGFLVYALAQNLGKVDALFTANQITASTRDKLKTLLKAETFFGSDANAGVACSAKMNMIVAGDGHTNIQPENSLARSAKNWNLQNPDVDLILTNPPFGTSENDALSPEDFKLFPISSTKGQSLFLQKMVLSLKPQGEVCTVIDEGMLNNEAEFSLRRWLLKNCQLLAVIRLPDETFKPNKINVRSSVLYMRRREHEDHDLEASDPITFCDIASLGYLGSGEAIRIFDSKRFFKEFSENIKDRKLGNVRNGYKWRSFDVDSRLVAKDATHRLDLKYWEPYVRQHISDLKDGGAATIADLNMIETQRGKSPKAELYVDETDDGYAVVLKAGSSITKFGDVVVKGDFIQKAVYDAIDPSARVQRGDVLLASTGTGTLGKCGFYDSDKPAVADGHVTIIRPNLEKVDPKYLADYLRAGFGAVQIQRIYSGSTGLIELTPEQVKTVFVDLLEDLDEQRSHSNKLRKAEADYKTEMRAAEVTLGGVRKEFAEGFVPTQI